MSKLLITGGTGSFGNVVAKRFINDKKFSEIIIFSRDEKKQVDMQRAFSNPKIKYVIGDIRSKDSIKSACYGVDYIFHAAALKHVPVGEFFPMEMVRTNVLGTDNVFSAAEECGVKKVILLSTDKASYPINALGLTKALAEKLVGSYARNSRGTVYCAVRYGNVMASRGSVIPLFVECIKEGKPLPITDPHMTRFLLSLDDAMGLVSTAMKSGKQGDIFVKKAPASTIGDLAQATLDIFNANNKIKIVGLRPGEKIHETIATRLELARAEEIGGCYRIKENLSSGTYGEFYDEERIKNINSDYTSENTTRLKVGEVEKLLLSLSYIKDELAEYNKDKKNVVSKK